MDLESTARELKMLAGKERLTASELDRAKDLMVEVKRVGMSNPEIVELSDRRWSESTVKGYTKGVRATDPEPWQSTTALFSEMLSMNLSLANVSQAMTISAELNRTGTSLDNVVSFMAELKQKGISFDQVAEAIKLNAELDGIGTSAAEIAGLIEKLEQENIDTPSFVLLFHNWNVAGLTAGQARSALNYKQQLEAAGFGVEVLPQIAEAAGKFGSPPGVLEAVTKYGSLGELDQDLQTKRKELETLAGEMESRSQELDASGQKLEEVQNKTAAMEKVLATYERLEAIGFDEKALGELAKATEKYGTPRKVLTALNRFTDLSKIKATAEEMQGKVQRQRTTLKDLEEKQSHLKSAIEMCQKLLRDYKFGLDAITTILATAKMYGDPIKVLKAVEAYGALKEIEKKTDQAKTALAEIQAKVEVQRETYTECKARNMEMLDQFEALNAKAIEVGREVGVVQEQTKKDTKARDILNLLQNPVSASYEEYCPLVLALLKCIGVWANTNKTMFRFSSLIDKNLQEVVGYLGGS